MLGSGGMDKRFIPSFNQALMASIVTQPDGFPDYPATGIRFVLDSVRDFFSTQELPKVKVFSTIGKPLDFHGVDCFFYYRGTVVTVDLTIKEGKKNPRADLVLTDQVIASSQRDIDDFAEQIANRLVSLDHFQLPQKISLFINNKYPLGYYVN
jgi:hypothetical protein